MKSVLILNGPNLDLLGIRGPQFDGMLTLSDVEKECRDETDHLGLELLFRQSNHEGRLIAWIHDAGRQAKQGVCIGAVFNPGPLTYTSVALRDAIEAAGLPTVELHIANRYNDHQFRRHSYLTPVSRGLMIGSGGYDYRAAINGLYQACRR
jgi:3-dehydroquinate dehydratase II